MLERKVSIPLDQLILATDNPRHEEVDNEALAIERLCRSENIDQLARDIAEHGINPAERLIIVPLDEDDAEDDATFIVAEGNRRVCALKLLNDPDLAPAKIRKKIETYAQTWEPISEIDVVVIADETRRRHWLMRIHDGAQNGRGRMPWKAEQKTRFTGGGRNAVAQSLLDYAEAEGMIDVEERSGRISHMARLVSNPLIRDALGLVTDDGPDELRRNRYKSDFDLVFAEIIEETKTKSLGSQAKKVKIISFAHKLQNIEGLSQDRLEDSELLHAQGDTGKSKDTENGDGAGKSPKRPPPPRRRYNIKWSEDIATELENLDATKLSVLHWSTCTVNAQKHTPLVAVGVWSFLDSLAALAGAKSDQSFVHFWKTGRISQLGVANGNAAKTINNVLDRLSKAGNNTKHDAKSAHFDYRQLINDWTVITPLVLAQLKELSKDE